LVLAQRSPVWKEMENHNRRSRAGLSLSDRENFLASH